MFRRYQVKGCLLEVWATQSQANTTVPAILTILPVRNRGVTISTNYIEELPRCRNKIITGNQRVTYMRRYLTTRAMFPEADNKDTDTQAQIGNNPLKEWTWQINLEPIDKTTIALVTLHCRFKLTYYSVMRDPNYPLQS